MIIMIIFYLKSYQNLIHFYCDYACKHMTDIVPNRVLYHRFVELQKKSNAATCSLLKIAKTW